MRTILQLSFLLLATIFFTACTIVRPGQVGVRQKLGQINDKALSEGPKTFNPLTSVIIKLPTRTVNMEIKSNLPSREGLTIATEISILYKIRASEAPKILRDVGRRYEEQIILPVFRSAAADVTARFLAKDLHSGERAVIENAIKEQMASIMEERGIIVENVLMKSIQLPAGLARTIEEKLQAEQNAQRLEFVKQQEQREAERRIIKAEGDRDAAIINAEAEKRRIEIEAEGRANAIRYTAEAEAEANEAIISSVTPEVLRFRAIEAFIKLSVSNNSKIILTDGSSPFLGLPEQLLKDN